MLIIQTHPPVLEHALWQAQEVHIQPSPATEPITLANMDLRLLIRSDPMRQELRTVFEEYFAPMVQQQAQEQIEYPVAPLRVSQENQASNKNSMLSMLQELIRHAWRPSDAQTTASLEPGSSAGGNV